MTGDPTRDDHATSHNLNSPPSSDYVAEAQVRDAKAAAREQREAEQRARWDACGQRMHVDASAAFKGVTTLCGRPGGHDGDCWPAPLAGDRKEGEG